MLAEIVIVLGILLLIAACVWTYRGGNKVEKDAAAHVESGKSHLRDRE